MAEALIALGGNLGDARTAIAQAIEALCAEPHTRLRARSSDYRTPPWGVVDQPAFVNCAIAVETSLSPRELLAHALGVERRLGRERGRGQRFGPRVIDIDLIAYDDLRCLEPDLQLPHPRLFERAFVLIPLAEIAPARMISGRQIRAAARAADGSGIVRLPD
ncbi:MAG: 2-amino-4-hydroxy-6-hydroxymethyldihydropteridine diphosphokinase [Proteobacteria bacterium]|nr:2-amino-4-hydroxy-6-hydroxymethyldihydropteridine diphosphokinase [Pseudomonadota bacterium]